MTLFSEAVEVMARAVMKSSYPRTIGATCVIPGDVEYDTRASLTALLAFLTERGLRVVPVEKTFTDAEIASINWPQPGDPNDGIGVDEARDCASEVWAAMIETIPNVWEEKCMTSAALGDAP